MVNNLIDTSNILQVPSVMVEATDEESDTRSEQEQVAFIGPINQKTRTVALLATYLAIFE